MEVRGRRSEVRRQRSDIGELTNAKHGITLIALIITVIILLILAGTAISISINGGDLFGKSQNAVAQYNSKVDEEENKINEVWSILNSITEENGGGAETPAEIKITLNGIEETLTQANFAEHLGKIATKYTGAPTTITTGGETYTVSNTYRLFWIDWDGTKYGDGEKTIYLKADCTGNNYDLLDKSNDVLDGANETSKIQQLNPALYVENANEPISTNNNMKATRWLTDTNIWSGLKISAITASKYYVVGAPSLEMIIDSYNTHYGLTGDTPNKTWEYSQENLRTKVFCKFPYDNNKYGYCIGPSSDQFATEEGFSYTTTDGTIQPENATEQTMYYPGRTDSFNKNYYWLASPSAGGVESVIYIDSTGNGRINNISKDNKRAFCPMVSISSDASL